MACQALGSPRALSFRNLILKLALPGGVTSNRTFPVGWRFLSKAEKFSLARGETAPALGKY